MSDVAVGSLGLEREGWFNAWDMLKYFRRKSIELGAQYLNAEAVDFIFEEREDILVDGVQEATYRGTNEIVVSTSSYF